MPKTIIVEPFELYDERSNKFISMKKPFKLRLECSLMAIAKWESKWHKPYLVKEDKTYPETIHFIECMTLTQNVDPNVYKGITNKNIQEIQEYIDDPMTATVINSRGPIKRDTSFVTAETIYYAMLKYGIPFECQKWHINRLIKLIEVCNEYNAPQEKRSQAEILADMDRMNTERLKKWNTKG